MRKIKDFFGNQRSLKILGALFVLIASALLSIGIQSLLMWIGGLFPSVDDLSRAMDVLLGAMLVAPIFVGAGLTENKGNGNIILAMLAIIGIYICVVYCFSWLLLIFCILLLWLNLKRLDNLDGDTLWIYGGGCAYLLYCIGAYFALIFNDLEPDINTYGITVLSVATLCMWFPAFRDL